MAAADENLPEWIASRLEPVDFNKDLTQQQVAAQFWHGDRPYYNVTKMHAALGGSVSRDTVQSRMDELHERDVLKREKINNGGVFWFD